jgi:CheY-like chemotaxis protein
MIVSGYLGTLRKLAGDDPRGQRAIQALEAVSNRGQSLTRQLLAFARRQPLSPIATTIEERLAAVHQLLTASVGGNVQIVHAVAKDIWPIRVDINELELALLNLGINARDAMPHGGVITIAAENVSITGSDSPDHLSGDFVRVVIADTGSGIPADILPRVFEPFFTTKDVDKGSGLGLAQVHGFAHQSGGTVTVESEVGRGTRVVVYLPRALEAEAAVQASSDLPAEAMGRLLLVEDNPDVADATGSMLLQLGYDVTHARNASAALSAAKEEMFDLVISDIVMAGEMNGLDLARKLRELYPALPMMLVTGYSDLADVAAREFTLMRKPYQASEIGRAAANLLAQARHRPPDNLVNLRAVREAAQGEKGR